MNPSLTPSGLSRPLSGMLRKSPRPPSTAPPTSEVSDAAAMRAARAALAADTGGRNILAAAGDVFTAALGTTLTRKERGDLRFVVDRTNQSKHQEWNLSNATCVSTYFQNIFQIQPILRFNIYIDIAHYCTTHFLLLQRVYRSSVSECGDAIVVVQWTLWTTDGRATGTAEGHCKEGPTSRNRPYSFYRMHIKSLRGVEIRKKICDISDNPTIVFGC